MSALPVTERGYTNPYLLVESDWLADHLDDEDLRLIDTRSQELYEVAHIPGAVNLLAYGGIPRSPDREMGSPQEFEQLAAQLGISATSNVVVYDTPGAAMGMAAWAFMYYGLTRVAVLDGGFEKWTQEMRPTSAAPGAYPESSFKASLVDEIGCTLEHARPAIGSSDAVFWDVRSKGEYDGSQPLSNPRPGHIAGAVNLEWTELLDPETKTFKTAWELQDLLASRGITPESEIICY